MPLRSVSAEVLEESLGRLWGQPEALLRRIGWRKNCACRSWCRVQERVNWDCCHSIPPPRPVSSPPIPRTLCRAIHKEKESRQVPLVRHLCNHYPGWIWRSRWHFMPSAGSRSLEGIGVQSQTRGLAESSRDGLDCLGTRSTWVVTDAGWAPLLCCSSKLCASLPGSLFLSISFCPQTTEEVSWGTKMKTLHFPSM